MNQWVYRRIWEIPADFLENFDRYQEVRRCWRRINGRWELKNIAFLEEWEDEDRWEIVRQLREILKEGGAVFAAFEREREYPIAFAAVEGTLEGSQEQYAVLHFIYTDRRWRGKGIGGELFRQACEFAREIGAKKLYISAHSSEESQRFYRRLGCVDAQELIPRLYELEPWDCHIEYLL